MSYSERFHIIVNSGNEGAPTSLCMEGSGSGGGVSLHYFFGFLKLHLGANPKG